MIEGREILYQTPKGTSGKLATIKALVIDSTLNNGNTEYLVCNVTQDGTNTISLISPTQVIAVNVRSVKTWPDKTGKSWE